MISAERPANPDSKANPGWLPPEELARLNSLELRARGVVEGFLQGLHPSPFVGYSVEFSAHRRYGPGDDLRHVNWKVFARQRKLYVKEFDAETNLNLYLLVDASCSMRCRVDGAMTKHDYAATLAAALAWLAMKQRDAVALGLMDDGITDYLDPSAKPGRWEECLKLLSRSQAQPVTALGKSLEQASALARHRGIVAIFSDLVDDTAAIERGLVQLRHRGHEVVLFHLLDPCERHLTQKGRLRVTDLEGGAQLMTDAEGIRAAYLKRVDRWCAELADLCVHQGVDRIELTTDKPPAAVLFDYLVRRST
ncbi:DUF58 domain-containing protein [Bremerella cremea]|uniref:DUF58 domain-containing protein n=1 Tax=Bremerella cremea TaxID=1031537 RepID=A0A368KPT2_9BACT|nr:DUF58 domain-containing protein [Bremerella cremea]RCS43541.1 DUF58 domain-containing protein [Bremerella cremea]